LEKEGHYVVTLDNRLKVTPSLFEGNFDVFILNIETPGVREKDLIFDIQRAHRPRILLIVAERGDAFLQEAMNLGVYGFIYKPFKIEEVCTLVSHLTR
jgi:DNA-binding NtrC family response regulator